MLKLRSLLYLALALVIGWPISVAARQESASQTDRVYNKDRWQTYPRWTRELVQFPSSGGTVYSNLKALAVEADGTVHGLLLGTTGFGRKVFYTNNRPDTRTRNGFSAPFELASFDFPDQLRLGDIAAHKDGKVAVVYQAPQKNANGSWYDIGLRVYTPASGWSGQSIVTDGSFDREEEAESTKFKNRTFVAPSVSYDDTGALHMAFVELYRETIITHSSAVIDTYQDTVTVCYSRDGGGKQTVATGTTNVAQLNIPTTGSTPTYGVNSRQTGPIVAGAPNGDLHLVWKHIQTNNLSDPSILSIKYSRKPNGGGSWSTTNLISEPGAFFEDFDVATDDQNGAHIVFGKGNGGTQGFPVYRYNDPMGSLGPEENIPTFGTSVKIATDARRKPVVVAAPAGGATSLATKVDNEVSDPNKWVIQEGFDVPGFGVSTGGSYRVMTTPGNEFVHFLDTGGIYYRTTELNTGVQDPLTMVPFGPGTSANVATGNLRFELPLFSARSGFGFGTDFSLLYNSLNGERGTISPGWSTSYDLYLRDQELGGSVATINLLVGEGQVIPFTRENPYGYHTAPAEFGYFSKLEKTELTATTNEYLVTTKFGLKYKFDNTGRLTSIKDLNDNEMTFTYENGRLTSMQDSPSRPATTLTYDAKGRLERVTDPASNSYKLSYQDDSPANSEPGKLELVKFEGAPAGQNVQWKFEYHTENDFESGAQKHRGLLSKMYTPRGRLGNYAYKFGYKPDGRVVSSTPPGEISGDGPRREIEYIDPVGSFEAPHIDEGASGTRTSPAAIFVNRRGYRTRVEFQYMRCLADRVRDEAPLAEGGTGKLRRFYDTEEVTINHNEPPVTVPKYRNLKRQVDREGNESLYFYTHEEGTKETPEHVRDNLRRLREPAANSSDPAGPSGAPAASNTAIYTYEADFCRPKTIQNGNGNITGFGYDTKGNVLSITYPTVAGQGQASESFSRDNRGRALSSLDTNEGLTLYQYNNGPTGLPTAITRPGHTFAQTMDYDVMGNETLVGLPLGGTTNRAYDNLYRLTSESRPAGDVPSARSFAYDEDSNPVYTDGPGDEYTEDDFNRLDRRVARRRRTAEGAFLLTSYVYDPEGNLTEVADPRTKTSSMQYDALNRVVREIRPGNPGPNMVTQVTYNLNGRVKTRSIGGDSPSTSVYTMSGRGLLLGVENTGIAGVLNAMAYKEDGQLQSSSLLSGGTTLASTSIDYDARERVIASHEVSNIATGAVLTTQYVLDRNGNRRQVIDPQGRISFYEFDAANRPTIRRDHAGRFLSENVYDENDRVTRRLIAHPSTGAPVVAAEYVYNDRGDLKISRDAFGNETTFLYDGQGNVLRADAPAVNGQTGTTLREYDPSGRLTRETVASGSGAQSVWQYEYDANGNRTRVTDPRLHVYLLAYDDANRLIELTYPPVSGQTSVETWTYDDRGNLATHASPDGKVGTMSYDALNRLTVASYTKNGASLANLVRSYDERGNVVSITDTIAKTKVTFADEAGNPAYDTLNRLLQVNWIIEAGTPEERIFGTVRYLKADGTAGYDGSSRLTDMIDPEGHRYRYTYDPDGRLDEIWRKPLGSSTEARVSKTTYTQSGLRSNVTLLGGSTQTYGYDIQSRLTAIELLRPDASSASRVEYRYDPRSRRDLVTYPRLNRQASYAYDDQSRLLSETWTDTGSGPPPDPCVNNIQELPAGNKSALTAEACATALGSALYAASWEYDPSGNRTRQVRNGTEVTTYLYDEQNRLTEESRDGNLISYGYDPVGNQTSRTAAGIAERFSYDYANRLATYEKGPVAAPTKSYLYRTMPTGERLAKIDLLGSVGNEEWYMYERADAAADYRRSAGATSFSPVRTYVNGRRSDSKIARIDTSEAFEFYAGDALGSVHQMIDPAGTVQRQNLYTAWGEALPGFTAQGSNDRYAFTQRENDAESDLMHYRARSYDPRTGRFLQTDPALLGRITKGYGYVGGNPVNLVDPTGMYEIDVHYYLTYYVARNTNFAPFEAFTIAGSTQYCDHHDSPTYPGSFDKIFNRKWLEAFHFAQEFKEIQVITLSKRAGERVRRYHPVRRASDAAQAIFNQALNVPQADDVLLTAGIGLHLYEDSWAHEGYNLDSDLVGHAHMNALAMIGIGPGSPDNPNKTPARRDKAMHMAGHVHERLTALAVRTGRGPGSNFSAIQEDIRRLFEVENYIDPYTGEEVGSTNKEEVRERMWQDFLNSEFGWAVPGVLNMELPNLKWNDGRRYQSFYKDRFERIVNRIVDEPR